MKVKVLATKPLSIQDKPDVKGVELTFELDGQTKTLSSWIPPVVSQAASWQIGQEVEIEEYTKDGKARFKTPQTRQGAPGGGGRSFQPDPLRYATDAAVALAQTAYRLPDGATENRTAEQAQGAFDHMLANVEKAIPRILKAMAPAIEQPAHSPARAGESGGAEALDPSEPPLSTSAPSGSEACFNGGHDWLPSGAGQRTQKCRNCPATRKVEPVSA